MQHEKSQKKFELLKETFDEKRKNLIKKYFNSPSFNYILEENKLADEEEND